MDIMKKLTALQEHLAEAGAIDSAATIEIAITILKTRNERISILQSERDHALAARHTAETSLEERVGDFVEMRDKFKAESRRMFKVIDKVGELHDVTFPNAAQDKTKKTFEKNTKAPEFRDKLTEVFGELINYREHVG